jgi:hypothetical protein
MFVVHVQDQQQAILGYPLFTSNETSFIDGSYSNMATAYNVTTECGST